MLTPASSPRNVTMAAEDGTRIQPPAGLGFGQEDGERKELPQVPSVESSPGSAKPARFAMTPGSDEDKIQELQKNIKQLKKL